MRRSTLTALLLINGGLLFGQSLKKFNYSACLKDCANDSSKVNEVKKTGRLAVISIKTYAPCSGNLEGGLDLRNNFLNLTFGTKPTIVKDKKGKTLELIEVADCNCMFNLKYQIKDLSTVDVKNIRINGLTLKEIDSKNIWTEEKEIKVEIK